MAWEVDVGEMVSGVHVAGETGELRVVPLQAAASFVLEYITSRWPVGKTALSLASFYTATRGGTVVVGNDTDYVQYVHEDAGHGGPPGLVFRLADAARSGAEGVFREELEATVKRSRTVGSRGTFQLARRTVTVSARAQAERAGVALVQPLAIPAPVKLSLISLLRSGRVREVVQRLLTLGYGLEAERLSRLGA